ncbi:MalY/PatB family protein [Sporosarcina pasteurii]|uniref:cysteine-S-conjugate beta-lyase n=1 Tax=Sporosarcina pasteurii TaxID=1474 RepID=A0A380C8F0_SPOPA|nr:MalY/PatB family protein [Sporosarcina pasteurii]MDS9472800.1 MalY/PatB family protein [Sporosarcina pasteurii]QBQ04451.1 pyridoxal phosphate-dependent aminotransferase [Sporosarcina pasteurii]SUJ15001.1 Cystathionine beta-lyase PatB [Sporosarcina pasteurii]
MSDFEHVIDRRKTRSIKWDNIHEVYGIDNADDILPMWIADMDFAAPKVAIDAMRERLDHGVFGYSYICVACKDAVRNWLTEYHSWETKNEWMLFHHGVVPAIASVIETFTTEEDAILITPPVYPPFFQVPGHMERTVVTCEMIENNGEYAIDFVKFEQALQQNVKVFILCNPHNPGGIVWSVEDLEKIVELCAKYDVLILSDEIHADLVFQPHKHTPIAAIAGEEAKRIITCVAPTKTFNLAGVQAAVMIASDEQVRSKLEKHAMAHGQMSLSPFAAAALKAAYEEGRPWLDELLTTVSTNMDYVIEQFQEKLPQIKVRKPQATYLLWIDYRETGLSEEEMMERLLHIGRLALEPGSKYGERGRGFLRMNVACPPSLVKEGVERFIRALD